MVRLVAGLRARPLLVDLLFYLGCAGYALTLALTNEFYGFRIWGNFALAGYGLAFLHTAWRLTGLGQGAPAWLRSRWFGIGSVAVVGMLAPLVMLVVRRLTGRDWLITPWSWSAQPEVWVIERSARLLLDTGTPYTDIAALPRPPEVNDYTPYGPLMPVFGLPRALFGGTPVTDALTDARLMFVLTAVACGWAALRLLRVRTVPVGAAQLAVVFPLTALTFATAAPDLAILGLIVLSAALAVADRPLAAAVVAALVVNAKATALPTAIVVAVVIAARLGGPALGRFVLAFAAVTAAVNVPVALVNPRAFAEHVVWFPLGMGQVASPAASPFPGQLLAGTGPVGQALVFVLIGVAGLAIGWWVLRHPPTTAADAMWRMAVGMGTLILLTPASRFGYLVYPAVLLGASLAFTGARQRADATSS
ncbi:hypothetical protein [Amycolatopsis suaedae]|uniref:DUF2029 domain-containing protein n=1 Tax=Amycolatopsis suaedae TaxID=2510978 RepID=A0A4Q7JE41_9PSEU|nr:hypothetical protein [Amycolatopsis suaedae]RZQ65717.1 hypothetical protein EWH70_01065 [Amycolatopsis suaedae]